MSGVCQLTNFACRAQLSPTGFCCKRQQDGITEPNYKFTIITLLKGTK